MRSQGVRSYRTLALILAHYDEFFSSPGAKYPSSWKNLGNGLAVKEITPTQGLLGTIGADLKPNDLSVFVLKLEPGDTPIPIPVEFPSEAILKCIGPSAVNMCILDDSGDENLFLPGYVSLIPEGSYFSIRCVGEEVTEVLLVSIPAIDFEDLTHP